MTSIREHSASPIEVLSELLERSGLCASQRSASSKIKSGVVRVNGLRVANVGALVVLCGPTHISVDDQEVMAIPR